MKTAVVTDTNSGIYEAEGAKMGVFVVPMPIVVGEETFYEGKNIDHEMFFSMMERGVHISTSQPVPEDLMGIWDKVLKDYDDLVYIPMSSGLSGSMQTARILSQEYEGRVQVADNHRISVTQRHSVMDALAMAEDGMNAAQIRNVLEQTALDSTVFLGLETLEYLKRGGRITPAAAAIGSILNIKPLLIIKGEKLDQYATARGTKNCKKKELEAIRKEVEKMKERGLKIRIAAAGSFTKAEDQEEWKRFAEESFPGEEVHYDPLSLSICCHTGPDSFGMGVSLAYERKNPNPAL